MEEQIEIFLRACSKIEKKKTSRTFCLALRKSGDERLEVKADLLSCRLRRKSASMRKLGNRV